MMRYLTTPLLSLMLSASTAIATDRERVRFSMHEVRLNEGAFAAPSDRAQIGYYLALNTPDEIKFAKLFNTAGEAIRFRMLADERTGVIIGTTRDGVRMFLVKQLSQDGQEVYVLSAEEKGGALITLDESDLYVTNREREQICFDVDPMTESQIPISVGVAVDRSGSMTDAIADVRASMIQFLEQVPKRAQCRVVFFNHDAVQAMKDGTIAAVGGNHAASCALLGEHAASGAYDSVLIAGGGTDIVPPLQYLYDGAGSEPEAVNVVLVISDGLTETSGFDDLTRRKQAAEAFTVVNWLGSYDQNYPLGKLSNHDVFGRTPGTPYAQVFFNQVQRQLNNHLVVKTRTCG